ncbi:MAG: hypothetical protein LBB95_02515 [Mycoplasmataceae bacterium]|nr:hypothetical protein [Mycoplasmataceae bacterium]
MTRKKLSLFCAISGVCATVGGTGVGISISQNKQIDTKADDNDEEYTKNFIRWDLHSQFSVSSLETFRKCTIINNHYTYILNETNFSSKLKDRIRINLSKESRFHTNADKYIIYVNYFFVDNKKVNIETIWTLTDKDYHNNVKDQFFYDLFSIFLHG